MTTLVGKLAHFSIINNVDWFTFQLSLMPMAQTGSLFNYQQRGLVHFSIIIDASGKNWLTFQLENGSFFIPSFPSFSLKLVTISIKNWFTIHLTKTHYQHAKSAGATIIAEPQDKPCGLRQYTTEDLQGHRWEFSQHLWDVAPSEWGAQLME